MNNYHANSVIFYIFFLFLGYNCELVTSYCTFDGKKKCENGGTCIGRTGGYDCLCAAGFTGKES